MEQIIGLYRILIGVSATALIFGLALIYSRLGVLRNEQKLLSVLAVANVASMLMLLLGGKNLYGTTLHELALLLDTLILVLNLSVAFFIFNAIAHPNIPLARHSQRLFLTSFVAICLYFSFYYVFSGDRGILNRESAAFPWLYGLSLVIFAGGSLWPAWQSVRSMLVSGNEHGRLLLILVLNGLNNSAGLVFFLNEFPTPNTGVVLNIVANLVFAYYLAYYFLSEYFVVQRTETTDTPKQEATVFSWDALSDRLQYWDETRAYLLHHAPEVVAESERHALSDLEKIHYSLKQLNIRAKDIATAMNVSVRAVEMQRYRIKKKMEARVTEGG